MTPLRTPRLELRPVTLPIAVAVLEGRPRAEIEALVGASMPWAWPARALVEQVFRASVEDVRSDPEGRLWGDRFAVTLGSRPRVVGSVVFHGKPGPDGIAEVAFGIDDSSQGNGYGCEALTACVTWALSQPECTRIRAKTTAWHEASRRVLEQAGLAVVSREPGPTGEMLVLENARST